MTIDDDLLARLAKGGAEAVQLFLKQVFVVHDAGGADVCSKWIHAALPALPEPERAALVTSLVDAIVTNFDVLVAESPSTAMH